MGSGIYPVTPDLEPAYAADPSPRAVAASLRAFFRIAEAWKLTNEEARALLGRPARSTFYKWKRGHGAGVPWDTVRRVSYVLGIYKALQILFPVAAQADGWIRRPSSAFGGGSALERMLGGDVTDLAAVRRYLDTVRGQGA